MTIPIWSLLLWLVMGMIIGFILGAAAGKTMAMLHDEETEEKIEELRKNRIDFVRRQEKVRVMAETAKTVTEVKRVVSEFEATVKDAKEKGII